MKKNWHIAESSESKEYGDIIKRTAKSLQVSQTFAKILLKRMVKKYPDLIKAGERLDTILESFLNPSLKYLFFPTFLPDVERGAEIVYDSLQKGEKVLIWGDYDADGITSSVICAEFFSKHGYDVINHLPCRDDGYGINKKTLKDFIDQGIQLIISVDCGISDFEAIEYAKDCGVKVIITDHHKPPKKLPPADAIINPHLSQENENIAKQDIALAGVGVAFYFLCYVNRVFHEKNNFRCDMKEFLDLVALGTIADLVPLVGQNRILVKNGLSYIADCQRISIQALKEVSGYAAHAKLSAGQVAFGLAPRINAAGRMENPRIAFELLTCNDYEEARKLALILDEQNTKRKEEEEQIVEEACERAESYENEPSLVLVGESWNQGIIGIVSSRIVERFNKPNFILTKDKEEGYYKGSGRSIREIDLNDALDSCAEYLYMYGGHKHAAGLKLHESNIENFRKAFNKYVVDKVGQAGCLPNVFIDESLNFSQSSHFDFLKELELLEPFGLGNAEPVFNTDNVELKNIQLFGAGKKHLKIELYDIQSQQSLHARLWNTKEIEQEESSRISLAYSIELSEYKGIKQVNVKIKDMK